MSKGPRSSVSLMAVNQIPNHNPYYIVGFKRTRNGLAIQIQVAEVSAFINYLT